jgi:hypothetical protein
MKRVGAVVGDNLAKLCPNCVARPPIPRGPAPGRPQLEGYHLLSTCIIRGVGAVACLQFSLLHPVVLPSRRCMCMCCLALVCACVCVCLCVCVRARAARVARVYLCVRVCICACVHVYRGHDPRPPRTPCPRLPGTLRRGYQRTQLPRAADPAASASWSVTGCRLVGPWHRGIPLGPARSGPSCNGPWWSCPPRPGPTRTRRVTAGG